jgi:hypothetical protein
MVAAAQGNGIELENEVAIQQEEELAIHPE